MCLLEASTLISKRPLDIFLTIAAIFFGASIKGIAVGPHVVANFNLYTFSFPNKELANKSEKVKIIFKKFDFIVSP